MQRRKGRSKPDGSGPRVIAPQVDQAYGKSEQPPASQFETSVLQFLAVFFAAIMVEGVFLAVSVRGKGSMLLLCVVQGLRTGGISVRCVLRLPKAAPCDAPAQLREPMVLAGVPARER